MLNQESQSHRDGNPGDPVTVRSAGEIRRLIQIGSKSHRGVPIHAIARSCAGLTESRLVIDLAAARLIGVPVVVFRETRPDTAQPVFDKLSERERDVARLIAAGLSNAGISRALGISLSTVKDHVHHALTKTGLKSRTALASALAREGV